MLSCVNVNFSVFVNSEDESKLKSLICAFVEELNDPACAGSYIELENEITTIRGVSSVKFEINRMDDTKNKNIMEKNN